MEIEKFLHTQYFGREPEPKARPEEYRLASFDLAPSGKENPEAWV